MKYPAFLVAFSLAGFLLPACSSEVPARCHEELCVYPSVPVCDGDDLITSLPQGICAADICVYPPSAETCEFGCEAGACLDASAACRGVECNELPAASCDGTRLTTWSGGTCEAGTCSYSSEALDCASTDQQCVGGRCVDLCLNVECEEAPPSCDGDVRVAPSEFYCDGGECLPNTVDRFDCTLLGEGGACLNGECSVSDACDGVTCTEPPEDWCERFVLHSYSATGTCVPDAGHCAYEDTTTNCALSGGICVVDSFGASCVPGDPCSDISCAEAPSPFCVEDEEAPDGAPLTVRRVFSPGGTCTLGECWHPSDLEDCADSDRICSRGECVDLAPCDDIVCPASVRRTCDGNVAIEFIRDSGVCFDGECIYDEDRVSCEASGAVCNNGLCTPVSPCDGVSCATPPDSYCFGNEAIEFAPIGICDEGDCYYEPIVQDCAARFDLCSDGECVDP